MKSNTFKPIILVVFGFLTLFLLNNLLHFPPRNSYDASSHHTYADTLLTKNRYPVREETPHFHNPPTWYLIGSGSIWLTEKLFNLTDWRLSIKPWQMTNLLFGLGGLVVWFKIAQILFKKDLKKSLSFIILLFSFPVYIRVTSMLSIEPALMFLSSLMFYYYLQFCLTKKIKLKQILIMGILLGIVMALKITGYAFVATFGLLMVLAIWFKDKQGLIKAGLAGLAIAVIIFICSGWFYVQKTQKYGLFTSGRIYKTRIQPKSFYFDIPFTLMMHYPIRPYIGNRFFPVMYTDFWGDQWNYFPQRRYQISAEYLRTKNNQFITDQRLSDLQRQVRLNLITTIIMAIGFIVISIKHLKQILTFKFDQKALASLSLLLFFWVAFLGYFYFQAKAPSWDGSNIKPSHLVYIWPIPALFTIDYLFSRKNKILKSALLVLLIIPTLVNIWFNWF